MSRLEVSCLVSVLKELSTDLVFPGDTFSDGKVRAVLADLDYEKDSGWARDAGIVWARKHLNKSNEPILILGFDREETVSKRTEGSLLDVSGVGYVRLPARLEEIRVTIEKLRHIKPEGLDSKSVERNIEDFARDTRSFWHEIKNLILALNATVNGLVKANDVESRNIRMDNLMNILRKQSKDLIAPKIKIFNELAEECGKTSSLKHLSHSLDNIHKHLTDAESIISLLLKTVTAGHSPSSSHEEAVSFTRRAIKELNKIESEINQIAPKGKEK